MHLSNTKALFSTLTPLSIVSQSSLCSECSYNTIISHKNRFSPFEYKYEAPRSSDKLSRVQYTFLHSLDYISSIRSAHPIICPKPHLSLLHLRDIASGLIDVTSPQYIKPTFLHFVTDIHLYCESTLVPTNETSKSCIHSCRNWDSI